MRGSTVASQCETPVLAWGSNAELCNTGFVDSTVPQCGAPALGFRRFELDACTLTHTEASGDACLEQLYPLLLRCFSGLVASMDDQWGLQVQIGHGATGLLGSLAAGLLRDFAAWLLSRLAAYLIG